MFDSPTNLTLEQKRQLAKQLLANKQPSPARTVPESTYRDCTYDMFMQNMGRDLDEVERFNDWVEAATKDGVYAFEAARNGIQASEVELVRETGEKLRTLNFSSYNYLGFSYHPEVIAAAQRAVEIYGLGAASSPVISGTYTIHRELEQGLVDFFGFPGKRVSLFSSGYNVNLGVIQAIAKPGSHVVLDASAHISLLEGAKLSGATIHYFRHNDMAHLEEILHSLSQLHQRIIVCAEGVYSADGDKGRLSAIVEAAKKYGALTLVDEAHSMLVAGARGRGVAEEQGVLEYIDLLVMTFSKAFGGVGGAVLADKPLIRYINWYAKCRMFSCALDPAVTGGMVKVLELASGDEGRIRRQRLHANTERFRQRLEKSVRLSSNESWIVPVIYGSEKKTLELNNYLQRQGLDSSIIQFPAVPKNDSRIRLFVTSELSWDQMERAALIVERAADRFGFRR